GPTNDNVEEMLEQVAAGAAVCFAPQSMALYYARPDLAWIPLTDVPPLRVALAWPEGPPSPPWPAFPAAARDLPNRTRAAGRTRHDNRSPEATQQTRPESLCILPSELPARRPTDPAKIPV